MLLAFPVGVGACYAALAVRVFSRWARSMDAAHSAALVACLHSPKPRSSGKLAARFGARFIGPRFESLHNFVFLLTPPAVATFWLHPAPPPPLESCGSRHWLFALALLANYDMMEKFIPERW